MFRASLMQSVQFEIRLCLMMLQFTVLSFQLKLYAKGFSITDDMVDFGTGTNDPENSFIHLLRIFLAIQGFMIIGVVGFFALCFVFLTFSIIIMRHNQQTENQIAHQRNLKLINAMKKFPFGEVIFSKSELECALCLEQFESKDASGNPSQLVQLKCSKFHIFHFSCFKLYLESQTDHARNKKCPLCRQPI